MKRFQTMVLPVVFASMMMGGGEPPSLWAEPAANRDEAVTQAVTELESMIFRVSLFHHEARSSLIASLELPVFADYFSLEDSKSLRRDAMGGLLQSSRQEVVRRRMEELSSQLYKKFPIGEICVVDRHGQEHMRFANGRVEPPSHFSDSEHGSPFFTPSFELAKGQVHQSDPYMSADSFVWVVAFTSPIQLPDGEKPAFLHFEVPLAFYQTVISTKSTAFATADKIDPDAEEEGRYFILTRDDRLIADSRQAIRLELKDERHPEKNLELPDYLPPERLEDYLPPVSSISSHPAFLQAIQEIHALEKGVKTLTLDQVDYVLAFQKVPDRPWLLVHLDPVTTHGFWMKGKVSR